MGLRLSRIFWTVEVKIIIVTHGKTAPLGDNGGKVGITVADNEKCACEHSCIKAHTGTHMHKVTWREHRKSGGIWS